MKVSVAWDGDLKDHDVYSVLEADGALVFRHVGAVSAWQEGTRRFLTELGSNRFEQVTGMLATPSSVFVPMSGREPGLACLDLRTGGVRWRQPVGVQAGAFAWHAGHVVVLRSEARTFRLRIERFDEQGGRDMLQTELVGMAAAASTSQRLFLGGRAGLFVSDRDGFGLTQLPALRFVSPLKAAGQRVYFGCRDEQQRQGVGFVSSTEPGPPVSAFPEWGPFPPHDDRLLLHPTAHPGRVVVGPTDHRWMALVDIEEGRVCWRYEPEDSVLPCVTPHGIFGVVRPPRRLTGELVLFDENGTPTPLTLDLPHGVMSAFPLGSGLVVTGTRPYRGGSISEVYGFSVLRALSS